MEKKMRTGIAFFLRKDLIYGGDDDALKSASDNEIFEALDQRFLKHRSIEKDGRRKNLKKKKDGLANNFSKIRILFCELLRRNNLRKQQRDNFALKLVLRTAAAKNTHKRPIVRTGTVIPIGLPNQSRSV